MIKIFLLYSFLLITFFACQQKELKTSEKKVPFLAGVNWEPNPKNMVHIRSESSYAFLYRESDSLLIMVTDPSLPIIYGFKNCRLVSQQSMQSIEDYVQEKSITRLEELFECNNFGEYPVMTLRGNSLELIYSVYFFEPPRGKCIAFQLKIDPLTLS